MFSVAHGGINTIGSQASQCCNFVDVEDHGLAASKKVDGIQNLLKLCQREVHLQDVSFRISKGSAVHTLYVKDLRSVDHNLGTIPEANQFSLGGVYEME